MSDQTKSSFFVDATLEELSNVYFKGALYGAQGSGKTHTAVNLAMGIAKEIGAPGIAIFDTERSASFHKKRVKAAGLGFYLKTAKSLDLATAAIWEAERMGVPLVLDSCTHLYRELVEAYCKSKKIKAPTLRDWGFLKPMWYQFADAFVHSKAHIIACGRAGIVTEDTENDEGKVDGFKVVDTKMKAEAEFGYEANLELEMESVPLTTKLRKQLTKELPKEKHQLLSRVRANMCIVKKDRNPDPKTTMMGREFWFPIYNDFGDHMRCLNFKGKAVERSLEDSSEHLFAPEGGPNMAVWMRKKETILAKLKDEVLVLAGLDGTGKETKLERARALIEHFGTAAWPEIEDMRLEELLKGIDGMRKEFRLSPYDLKTSEELGAPLPEEFSKSNGTHPPQPEASF